MTDKTQTELYRDASRLCSEIESLEGMKKSIVKFRSTHVSGSIIHHRTSGIPVSMPRGVALRVLTAEIAAKEAQLSKIKEALK